MTECDCHLAFSLSSGIGPKRFGDLLKVFGSARSAWDAEVLDLKQAGVGEKTLDTFLNFRKTLDISLEKKKLSELDIAFIAQSDAEYPKLLSDLPNAPIGIFAKGNTQLLKKQNVLAVVGSRKTTQYGREATASLVSAVAEQGIVIISGLALGIDAIAHMACIDSRGRTIAVLACGVDCCYPQENYNVYKKILAGDGLIISEYPLSAPPSKGSFLSRNRIIAALSKGILVSEATEDSGSLITAEWGRKLGKEVFAVPGPITSQNSYGTLGLIQKGATLVRGPKDILKVYQVSEDQIVKFSKKSQPHMSKEENVIYELLSEEKDVEELRYETGLAMSVLNSLLSEMELNGYIHIASGKVKRGI